MKTLKIQENTHTCLMSARVNEKIDHHLNLKTLDNVIELLYQCYLEIDKKTLERIIEDMKEDLKK